MSRRPRTVMYSPGGCGCALLMVPFLAVGIGMIALFAGLAVLAVVLLAIAVGVTVWLYRRREERRVAGKSNAGWIVFLVVAYLLSVSYLAFFILMLVSTVTGEPVTVG